MTPNRVESGEIFQTASSFFILFPSVINLSQLVSPSVAILAELVINLEFGTLT